MNKYVIPLIATALLCIGAAMFISCGDQSTTDTVRFEKIGEFQAQYTMKGTDEPCLIRVVRDRTTGCEYILSCNAIASMPHTCFLDRATDEKVLGVPQ